jgi:outer membrane protein TolC
VEGACARSRALESDLRRTGLDIVASINAAFYEALRRRDFIEIARQALESSEKHVGQAQALLPGGSGAALRQSSRPRCRFQTPS